jgi:GxxExxY protein
MDRNELERIAKCTLDCAFKVHTALGPGMLESAYEACLMYELNKRGLESKSQVKLPIIYDGKKIDAGYRLDLFVESELIVELKAVEKTLPVHTAQLLSYLKLSNKHLGLLINFNVPRLMNGIKRVVNGL